jgi:lipid II:glycine glycyltransferase (peptidoglycan interpeptide bridge formation enzyme)
MQNLMPLPRTAAIPITTSDYNKSIRQNIQLMENGRNYKQSDMNNRQEMSEQKKKEWERMSNNIKLFGNQNKIVVDFNRPQDTRQ